MRSPALLLALLLACAACCLVSADHPIPYALCSGQAAGGSLSLEHVVGNASVSAGLAAHVGLVGILNATMTHGSFLLTATVVRAGAKVVVDEQFGSVAGLLSLPTALPLAAGAVNVHLSWMVPPASTFQSTDQSLVVRIEILDQSAAPFACVEMQLALNPGSVPGPDSTSKSKILGYVCALISVVFFGTNFLPVKAFDTGDGVFFQWVMCVGVWMVGLIVNLVRGSPPFEPFAMVGGVMWAIGNATTVPIIQCIGLGVGICLWGTAGLVMGWASGRFGLLGVNKQDVENQFMNVAGLLLCVASMGVMVSVKTVKAEAEAEQSKNIDGMSLLAADDMQMRQSRYASNNQDLQLEPKADVNWTEKLSPGTRRILGISLALFAGCLYGLNFNPPQSLIDSGKGFSSHGIDYVFSHFTGIFLTSTVYMVAYAAYKRNAPQVIGQIVVPGLVSGVGWAIAQTSWFVANEQIGFIGTFPLVSCGPGIVATLCAIVFYREIQGTRNFARLGVAAVTIAVGVLLIAFSLPAS